MSLENLYLLLNVLLQMAMSALPFILFLAGVVIWEGWRLRWRWVLNPWLRLSHLILVLAVVADALPLAWGELPGSYQLFVAMAPSSFRRSAFGYDPFHYDYVAFNFWASIPTIYLGMAGLLVFMTVTALLVYPPWWGKREKQVPSP